MPFLLIASVIVQLCCGYHVVKTGQDRYWIFLILMAPGIGCLIYALAIMLPSMMGSRQGKQTISLLHNKIDPERRLRALHDELSLRDTPQVRTHLADELMGLQQYDEAIEQYQYALTGQNQYNPETLLKVAHAYFNLGKYAECLKTLDMLLQNNPSYASQEGHLLQARALQQKGDWREADAVFRQVIEYYSGPDAHLHYAQMLYQQQRYGDARKQLDEILSYARIAPKHYKQFHKECLAQANALLKSLP